MGTAAGALQLPLPLLPLLNCGVLLLLYLQVQAMRISNRGHDHAG